MTQYKVYFDGATKGNKNGGISGCGAVLYNDDKIICSASKYLNVTTNNRAEYKGLILALVIAMTEDICELEVIGDSELVIQQMTGQYKTKNPELIKLKQQAKDLEKNFENVVYRHVYREFNTEADRLANMAIENFQKN